MFSRNFRRKRKGWVVKIDRPEEIYGSPEMYYTEEEIEKYGRSGGVKRAQESIAYRIINLLSIPSGSKVLDLGCGAGYTAEIYKKEGYNVTGLDILPKMLEKARQKNLKVIKGDARNLKEIFKKGEFDAVVSASALQWIKEKKDWIEIAEGMHYILNSRGRAAMQFYPKSQEELENVFKIFKKNGFQGNIITDNPENPKKRVVYLVLKVASIL